MINIDLFITLGENMAILFSIVFVYSLTIPLLNHLPDTFKNIIIGMLFGIIAIIGMFYPVQIEPGIIIDSRVVVVAIAGIFGGLRAGTTAGVMVSVYRYSLGGIGTTAGIGAIVVGAMIGIIVKHRGYSKGSYLRYWHFLLVGIVLAVQGLLWTFALPFEIAWGAFQRFALPVLIFYPVATLFLGSLFSHELSRREAEKALSKEQTLLRTLIDSIPDYIFVKDKEGRFLLSNHGHREYHGLSSSLEIIGKTNFDLNSTEEAQRFEESDQLVFETGQNVQNVVEETHKHDGTPIWVMATKVPLRDEGGKIFALLGVIRDFTEHKKSEDVRVENERLRVALDKEKEHMAIKDRFMTTIAHELRTPLTGISLAGSKLKRYWAQMNEATRISNIDRIIGKVQHLDKLLGEISMSMQASRGFLNYQPDFVNLVKVCEAVIDKLDGSLSESYKLEFTHSDNLDSILLDEQLIDHALVNLLSNAIKYMPDGGNITLDVKKVDENIIIQLTDKGLGISEEDQKNLYVPFFRGTNVGVIGGTGVGLSLVKDIISLHGGAISCESEINQGTTFTIEIPYETAVPVS